MKQESSQVQQKIPEQEPEPEPSTLEDPGITEALRHKLIIDVTTSVHLNDEKVADILKELEVNVHLPKLTDDEIKDATISHIKSKTPKADCKSKQVRKEETAVTKPKNVVKQSTFKLAAHGIRKRKRLYNFKCRVHRCDGTFKSKKILERAPFTKPQTHYLICEVCGKSRTTPSGFRVHQYVYWARKFVTDVINGSHLKVRW